MIVKVECSREFNSWRFYEAEEVQAMTKRKSKWQELDEMPKFSGPVDGLVQEHVECDTGNQEADPNITLISFWAKGGFPIEVYTEMRAYLLNDDGKTIDRLN